MKKNKRKKSKKKDSKPNSPVLAFLVGLELSLDHVDHDLIADQTTLVHDQLGLLAELGLLSDLGAEHITGRLYHCERQSVWGDEIEHITTTADDIKMRSNPRRTIATPCARQARNSQDGRRSTSP